MDVADVLIFFDMSSLAQRPRARDGVERSTHTHGRAKSRQTTPSSFFLRDSFRLRQTQN